MTSSIIAVKNPSGSGWILVYIHGKMVGGKYSDKVYASKHEAENNII
jgi:hypothetical protein